MGGISKQNTWMWYKEQWLKYGSRLSSYISLILTNLNSYIEIIVVTEGEATRGNEGDHWPYRRAQISYCRQDALHFFRLSHKKPFTKPLHGTGISNQTSSLTLYTMGFKLSNNLWLYTNAMNKNNARILPLISKCIRSLIEIYHFPQ